MKKIYTCLIAVAFVMTFWAGTAKGNDSGTISPRLKEQIQDAKNDDLIRINIFFREQFDIDQLLLNVETMGANERREYVVSILKEFSTLSQKSVKEKLVDLQIGEKIKNISTLWVANVINCYATPEAIAQLNGHRDIELIDHDVYQIVLDPAERRDAFAEEGDPENREITWNVTKINAQLVWALGFNGEGVVVAVIDTGVNYNHLDLVNNVWQHPDFPYHGWNYVNNSNNPMDDNGHGTHCAGTVAGDGSAGSQTGIAPGATIMCLKVLDSEGGGNQSAVWSAVQFSIENGAHVLSLSLGWQHSWGPNRTAFRQAFDSALAAGLVASVAAGNEGDQQGSYPIPDNVRTPGDCPPPWLHPEQTLTGGVSSVVCVGATDINDGLANFSGRGPLTWTTISPYNDYAYQPGIGLIRPDISAPGVSIKSLAHYSNTGYESGWSGTSMATPAASGVMALMVQKNMEITSAQISQILEETAFVIQPSKNNNSGSGRINALAAIEAVSAVASPTDLVGNVTYANGEVHLNWQFIEEPGFEYFKIYRNNMLVNTSTSTNYSEILSEFGIYEYKVTAQHTTGESNPTNSVILQWGEVNISISPSSLEETLANGQTSTQQLTVQNTGDLPLDFDISIEYVSKSTGQCLSTAGPDVVVDPEYIAAAYAERMASDGIVLSAAKGVPGGASPNMTDDEVIRYDDGTNVDAIGLTAGGTFHVSAYWPASTMGQYAGMKLDAVEIFVYDAPTSMTLNIYGQGTATVPGALLHSQPIAAVAQTWVMTDLTSQVDITGADIWIGYEVTHTGGTFCAGVDPGPAVAGYGDMISLPGGTYESMSISYGLNYNWNIAGYLVTGVTFTNDVGVQAIVQPTSGISLGNEPVVVKIKNYGTVSLSNIPWSVNWTGAGSGSFNGTYAGPLAAGAEVNITSGNANLAVYGTYNFEGCTSLARDENPANNCKIKAVVNTEPTLCVDNLYTSGCSFGDGLTSWSLQNITVANIPCAGTPPWYQNYMDQIHNLEAGNTYVLTVTAGYADTYFDVWIDFDGNLELNNTNELILNDAICAVTGTVYTFNITIPGDAPSGEFVMRSRTNWTAAVTDPCETYTYGNCIDFKAQIGGSWLFVEPMTGTVDPGETMQVAVTFNSEGLEVGNYNANLVITSNAPGSPNTVPVNLDVIYELILPTVTTADVTDIAINTATAGGNVLFEGASAVTSKGVVWCTFPNPTVENNEGITIDGSGTGSFVSYLTGLSSTTTYYTRAYAVNEEGVAYGSQKSFSTFDLPSVTTNAVIQINFNSAISGGNVILDGNTAVSQRGVVWSTNQNPTIENNEGITFNGSGLGQFTSLLGNLNQTTTYYVRAYAINSMGTAYGAELSFTTPAAPEISINPELLEELHVFPGEITTQTILITNTGGSALEWNLDIQSTSTAGHDAVIDQEAVAAAYAERMASDGIVLSPAKGIPGGASPNMTDDEVIRYDDGTNADAIGLTAGGTFHVSAYWPASTMGQYAGMKLDAVEIFVYDAPTSMTLKIFGAGTPTTPGALLHSQPIAAVAQTWVMTELTSQVDINGADIWIGYEVTHTGGTFCAGVDGGPAVAGFGDMISLAGGTYESMSISYGLNYNWNIAGHLVTGVTYTHDVGVHAIVQPTTGISLGTEPVIIKIKNYGAVAKSNIPWSVSWTGAGTGSFNGTHAGTLAQGAEVDITAGTANLSAFGVYNFEACTSLAGDENPANNCKTKAVTNIEPSLCINNLYTSGCSFGDGLTSWSLQNITVANIPCAGTPPWYQNYMDQFHELDPGQTYVLTVTAGYAETYFDVWIDFDGNLELNNTNELVLNDAVCAVAGTVYTFNIAIPADAPGGTWVMRARTNWTAAVTDPCATYSYGNCVDFKAQIGGSWLFVEPMAGTVDPGEVMQLAVTFNSEGLEVGNYFNNLVITSNDPLNPEIEVPVSLEVKEEQEFFFIPVWTSPYNPMTFYLLEANIDELPMQAGDEIGLFDVDPNTGEQICVGAGVLVEALGGEVYLEIIASMDDGSNPAQANGFTPGNEVIYRLWNEITDEITTVSDNYPYPGYDEVYTSQGSAFVELNGFTTIVQELALQTGWNLISFRVMPENWNMLNIVQPLIDQEVLFKVLDETGGSIFHLPFPPPNGQWSNTIGDMANTEGYYVKVTGNDTLSLEGYPVETPMDIPLTTGWNIISYPCENPQNALDAVQPLIAAGVLFKVIDEAGGTIFHLPFPPPNGQWTNTIGNFQSGKGYYVKVNGATMLSIGCSSQATSSKWPSVVDQKAKGYFEPVWQNNPYMPMHIVLMPAEFMQAGDEIGVFDGDICVGKSVFNGDFDSPVIVIASATDHTPGITNGFISGNEITCKVYGAGSENVLMEAILSSLTGENVFEPLGTYVAKIEDITLGQSPLTNLIDQIEVIPNPASDNIMISFVLGQSDKLNISILDIYGQSVKLLKGQILNSGLNSIMVNVTDLKPGLYFLKLDSARSPGSIPLTKLVIN